MTRPGMLLVSWHGNMHTHVHVALIIGLFRRT